MTLRKDSLTYDHVIYSNPYNALDHWQILFSKKQAKVNIRTEDDWICIVEFHYSKKIGYFFASFFREDAVYTRNVDRIQGLFAVKMLIYYIN